jgi:hypothetical protein
VPILDPQHVRKVLDKEARQDAERRRRDAEFRGRAATRKRTVEIERVLRDNLTPDVFRLLASLNKKLYLDPINLELVVWEDGLRHSKLPGSIWRGWSSWWSGLASPRQVAEQLAKEGVNGATVQGWLERELHSLLRGRG